MEIVRFFEISVDLYLTRLYIPEDVFHACEDMFYSKRSNVVGFEVLREGTAHIQVQKLSKLLDERLNFFNAQMYFVSACFRLSAGSAGGGRGWEGVCR
jgi:phenylalanyl-tRNA synthetase alpha subunit